MKQISKCRVKQWPNTDKWYWIHPDCEWAIEETLGHVTFSTTRGIRAQHRTLHKTQLDACIAAEWHILLLHQTRSGPLTRCEPSHT